MTTKEVKVSFKESTENCKKKYFKKNEIIKWRLKCFFVAGLVQWTDEGEHLVQSKKDNANLER